MGTAYLWQGSPVPSTSPVLEIDLSVEAEQAREGTGQTCGRATGKHARPVSLVGSLPRAHGWASIVHS